MHDGAVEHDGEEKRAARRAAGVVQGLLSHDQELVRAVRDLELFPLDAGERLERRARRRTTAGAVAVRRIAERILDAVADLPALTPAGEPAVTGTAWRRFAVHSCSSLRLDRSTLRPTGPGRVIAHPRRSFLGFRRCLSSATTRRSSSGSRRPSAASSVPRAYETGRRRPSSLPRSAPNKN